MKNRIFSLFIALSTLLFFSRCNEETFVFVVPVPFSIDFDINEGNGVWNESEVVSANDFGDILEDYDDEAILDDVIIEGVVLYVDNQDPALTGIQNADLVIVDAQQNRTLIYQNVSITLENDGDVTRAIVTDLVEDGVILIKNLIRSYIDDPFITDSFILESTGNSVPGGTPLSMTLTIEVNMTANVSQDLEVPFFLGNK